MIDKSFDSIFDVIDNLLIQQKKIAHDAIDLNDWDKAIEIVDKSKEHIRQIEEWKSELRDIQHKIHQSDMYMKAENSSIENKPKEESLKINDNIKVETNLGLDFSKIKWHSLDEDYHLKKINAFKFGDTIFEVKSLSDAYVKICELFCKINKDKFMQYVTDSESQGEMTSFMFSYQNHYSIKMPDVNIYVSVKNSNNQKTETLKNLLKLYNLPKDYIKLSVFVK